jgi:perosamine synthetase
MSAAPAAAPALDPAAIVAAIRGAVGPARARVALHEPHFAGNEWIYVKEAIDSTFVSSVGPHVERFERALERACEARHAVATVNGTAALHVALVLAGVKPGDQVLCPALTFVATANAIVHAGATPHFVDSAFDTLGLDPGALARHLARVAERRGGATVERASGARIAAVVPMHTFGHPVDMDGLGEVARDWRLAVIEDATESLGSRHRGRPTGSGARLACLSFNGNKIVTTGGGGAILSDDEALARRARHLTTTAKRPHAWAFDHDEVAWNYRLPNLNAALGLAQLERLGAFVAAKRALARRYEREFARVAGVAVVREPPGAESNYWLNAILLDEAQARRRDEVLEATNAAGLGTRPAWTPMSALPMFAACPRAPLPVAESIARRLVNLPSSAFLGPGDAG